MDKAHITMIGTDDVFMTHTKGVAGDPPELINHIEALKKMDDDIELYSADGGHDSFLNHSDIWCRLSAKPIIFYASNAVINQEGEEERINHWVNKKWKKTRKSEMSHSISSTKRELNVKRYMATLRVQYNSM